MESLAIGSLRKPAAMIQYSGVVKPSSSLVLKHQACIFNKNRYMTFQQRHVNYHMAESFYKRSMLHGRPEKKFELDATSTNDSGSDAAHNTMNPMQTTVNFLDVLYRFIRPYAALGTALNVASMALLAVEKLSDFSPLFFVRLLQALVGSLLMQMYVTGFNQICDIELDKVNKPFLPLAAGDLSMRTAILVSSLSAIMIGPPTPQPTHPTILKLVSDTHFPASVGVSATGLPPSPQSEKNQLVPLTLFIFGKQSPPPQ
ncbi:unnamed protein product [Lactuca virosa]|uniref:Uncharacterized protein n=1 Tax=Lactuca virosa TaxID=75947 RepID=A0AAU9N710_9ASTR|nr:unnamed protein product [Lactuca virosa]